MRRVPQCLQLLTSLHVGLRAGQHVLRTIQQACLILQSWLGCVRHREAGSIRRGAAAEAGHAPRERLCAVPVAAACRTTRDERETGAQPHQCYG